MGWDFAGCSEGAVRLQEPWQTGFQTNVISGESKEFMVAFIDYSLWQLYSSAPLLPVEMESGGQRYRCLIDGLLYDSIEIAIAHLKIHHKIRNAEIFVRRQTE
jgi:hypothetical protein